MLKKSFVVLLFIAIVASLSICSTPADAGSVTCGASWFSAYQKIYSPAVGWTCYHTGANGGPMCFPPGTVLKPECQ